MGLSSEDLSEAELFQAALRCGVRKRLLSRQQKKTAARGSCDAATDSYILVDTQGQAIAQLHMPWVRQLAEDRRMAASRWRQGIGALGIGINIALAVGWVYLFSRVRSANLVVPLAWFLVGLILFVALAQWDPRRPFPMAAPARIFLLLDIPFKFYTAFWTLVGSLMMWGPLFRWPRIVLAVSALLMPIPPIAMVLILRRSRQRSA
jgi:hypothetical protein